MPTTKKRATVKELQQLFADSQVLIFTDYRGLTVSDLTTLRRQLREKGVEYHITKNTLTTIAAGRAGMEDMETMLDGPTAIAFVGDDIPGAAKVLSDFARSTKILQIRGGLMGKTRLNDIQVGDLTKILTREEYIAKILGSMQSPVTSLVNVLSGTIRSFMNVMQARVDQMKEQGGDVEAAGSDEAPAVEEAVAPEAEVAQVEAQIEATAVEAEFPPAEAPAEVVAEMETETETEAPAAAMAEEAMEPTEATAGETEEPPAPEAPSEMGSPTETA